MSNYTTELRYIIEECNGLKKSTGYNSINELIENAIPKIFEQFPIFDENYRNVLCTKILKHYYFYEIGTQTKGRFLFELNETLNLIMPYYNKLYLAWLQDFNPIYSTDLKTTHTGSSTDSENNQSNEKSDSNTFSTNQNKEVKNNSGNTSNNVVDSKSGTNTTTDSGTERFSDTPQGSLQNIANNTYLTNATLKDDSKTTTYSDSENNSSTENYTNAETNENLSNTNTNNVNNVNKNDNKNHLNTNQYIDYVQGYSNCASENLQKYYNALLNIDELIIKDLSSCFMQIF